MSIIAKKLQQINERLDNIEELKGAELVEVKPPSKLLLLGVFLGSALGGSVGYVVMILKDLF